MTPLAALLVRDMRIALRVGGGALMGVLFFLVVVTLIPFAIGPDLVLLKRIGRRSCGSRRCLPACWRSTGCSPAIATTARST